MPREKEKQGEIIMDENFYLTPEEYMESTGDDCPCKYQCME